MLFAVDVRVVLKKGILDAEAETVRKSLNLLGIGVSGVETAKVYTLLIESEEEKMAKRVAEEACGKLLANPVINDFEIEVRDGQYHASE
jgi:phosphoribosylformylglycinamidine synthase